MEIPAHREHGINIENIMINDCILTDRTACDKGI